MAIDGGDLPLGGGLLALVRPALELLEVDGVLAVNTWQPHLHDDLSAWCRVERHEYLGHETLADGRERHLIIRGAQSLLEGQRESIIFSAELEQPIGVASILKAIPMPERADADTGFAPRGSQVEPGGPRYPFDLLHRGHVAPPEVGELYDQAVSAQWNAQTDIPWNRTPTLPPVMQRALGQVMTFLAENELSALYVPSRFVSRIHPAFAEVAMFLATQMADEARHIDVFLKRARIGGGLGVSAATTSQSLLSLLQLTDFTEATFLLSVLGEGTFLDLLTFVENHAPDEVTAEIARRTRNDEARHVHFGLAHIRHALAHEPQLYGRLEQAVRRRSASLAGAGGVPAQLQDGLTIMAAGDNAPRAVARGHDAFRELLVTMHLNRIKRLQHAGFTSQQAEELSNLHTPNFM